VIREKSISYTILRKTLSILAPVLLANARLALCKCTEALLAFNNKAWIGRYNILLLADGLGKISRIAIVRPTLTEVSD
jgi:hypothetical protein